MGGFSPNWGGALVAQYIKCVVQQVFSNLGQAQGNSVALSLDKTEFKVLLCRHSPTVQRPSDFGRRSQTTTPGCDEELQT